METKHLDAPFELKKVQEDGEFEGFASTFGNKDLGGDIVMPGAFDDAIKAPGRVALLWQHQSDKPIGIWTEFDENRKGLKVKGQLALGVTQGREAHELLSVGALNGLSIGFSVPKNGAEFDDNGVRRLKKLNLWEISIVTFPMNPKARVSAVKKIDGFRDLEIVDAKWDRKAAEARVREWAGEDDERRARAFLCEDILIGDIVNERLVAVADGIKAAAADLVMGGEPSDVYEHLDLYFDKLGGVAPWTKAEKGDFAGALRDILATKAQAIKTIRDFEDHLRDVGFSAAAAKSIASGGFIEQPGVPEPRDEDGNELADACKRAVAVLHRLAADIRTAA